MLNAQLVIRPHHQPERKIALSGSVSIGRAPDNSVCIEDANISRYHALIEERADGFYLSDLGSVNGTTVNDDRLTYERRLRDGDLISLGGTSRIEFHCDAPRPQPQPASSPLPPPVEAPPERPPRPMLPPQVAQASGYSPKLILAAVGVGLLVTAVAALLIVGVFRRGESKVAIVSPESGTTVRGPVTVRVEAEKARGIERLIYQLDGVEFASAEAPPYDVTLNPAQLAGRFPDLGSGNHVLSVAVEDAEGNKKLQPETVLLAFDLGKKSSGEAAEGRATGAGSAEGGSLPSSGAPGAIDVAALAQSLAGQITQKSGYVFDREFAEQINLRTAAYRVDVVDDARRYRREIIKAFRDKGLHPLFGFVMAMSRSRFKEGASVAAGANDTDTGVGLWRIPPTVAQGYLAPDESAAALSDPRRSAEVAAAYLKDLVGLFGIDDFTYAVACFGMPLSQAGQIRTRLEETAPGVAARGDFWKMVKSGVVPREAADRVARFFAAGIVGENPQAFGLRAERLSSLY